MIEEAAQSETGRPPRSLPILLFFTLLTVVAAWPLLTQLDSVLIGRDIDTYINPWADWWTRKALTDPQLSLWHTDYIFYPNGANLTFHSFSHLNTGVSLFLQLFMDAIPAYNLSVLLNFPLIGLAMFQFAYYLTRSTTGSLLAGIIFAFNSYNQYQSAHPVLISLWCLPWLALFFLKAVDENDRRWALAAGVFIGLSALASMLLLVQAGMLLALLLVFVFARRAERRPTWPILATMGLTALVLVGPQVFPLLREALLNDNSSFARDPAQSIVTQMHAVVIPHWFSWLQRGLYIGVGPFLLTALAFWKRWRAAWPWLALLVGSYLLAIGPHPVLGSTELDITLPWSLLITPLLRNPHRMMNLLGFGLALTTAYGWQVLAGSERLRRSGYGLAAALAVLVVFVDYTAAPFPVREFAVSDFYTVYLADVPDDVVLATIPSGRQPAKLHHFYQTFHEHPITAGVVSRTEEDESFIYGNPLLRAGVKEVSLDAVPPPLDNAPALADLAAAGVGYIVIEKTLLSPQMGLDAWRAALPGRPVYEDELVLVFATE